MTSRASSIEHQASILPLIVITGPTASGKSSLAIELAKKYAGEIICADSRTVYREMDIGTAKPSADDRAQVPHHLLDVIEPDCKFTAAQFKELAERAIVDIRSRGKTPFLVGGTGLYIDSVILNYQFGSEIDETKRQQLEKYSVDELQEMYEQQHLLLPENHENRRHLVNGLLRQGHHTSRKSKPSDNVIVVAISTDKHTLRSRIEQRSYAMFDLGVVEETKLLADKYGWDSESMTGNIYPIIRQYLDGQLSRQQAIEAIVVRDWRLAKRQLTWLRRHEFVKWLSLEEARIHLSTILDRY